LAGKQAQTHKRQIRQVCLFHNLLFLERRKRGFSRVQIEAFSDWKFVGFLERTPQNLPPLYPCSPDLQLGVFCKTRIVGTMPRSRKLNLDKVRASLDAVCPKCGGLISPAEVRRIDFERIESPVCGEQFAPSASKVRAG
jgi:hypothetical protein